MQSRWWIFCFLLLALLTRFSNLTETLIGGRLYFLDADCYSRMTRAQIVSRLPGTVVHHQRFENWPEGVASHATAPMDYLIVGLERCLQPFWPWLGRFSSLKSESLDVAGALISPLLGLVLCFFCALWAHGLRGRDGERPFGWWMTPLLLAVSPAVVHATVFARPDHQSALLCLLGVALASEQRLLSQASLVWSVLGGVSWGMALWVSLYEPAVLLGIMLVWEAFCARAIWRTRGRLVWVLCLAVLLVVAWKVEGFPTWRPGLGDGDALRRWGKTIGELASTDLEGLGRWGGLLIWVAPVSLWLAWRRAGEEGRRWVLILSGLLTSSAVLTVVQARWAPFFTLIFALAMPWVFPVSRRVWAGLSVALLSLWPLARDWESRWFPEASVAQEKHLDRSERIQSRLAAERMRSAEVRPFLAPWWISPSLAYWSGQPGVAGSGHEGIAGIQDTARFFLSTNPAEAREILERRGVYWVVAGDSARVVINSAAVLGREVPRGALAERLWGAAEMDEWGLEGERNTLMFRLLRFAGGTP